MKIKISLFLLFLSMGTIIVAQNITSRKHFFNNDTLIEATLTTNFNTLINQKKDPTYQPAIITWHHADSAQSLSEDIKVRLRGNFRKDQCSFASMMFDFSDSTKESRLKNLKELKIVVPCEWGSDDEQWVLREFLIYKIYQLFTPMSYRIRLIRFKFDDNSGFMKPYRQYGFAIEPVDDLAKRNNCKEVSEKKKVGTDETDRKHTTMVSVFQYMIGNTDWAVPQRHNIKMLAPKGATAAKPYIVPYDFDYCGAVNALYADPAPHIGIEKVTDRKYWGPKRELQEIKDVLPLFKAQEAAIFKLIDDFVPLKKAGKEEMALFIKAFFVGVEQDDYLKRSFIEVVK